MIHTAIFSLFCYNYFHIRSFIYYYVELSSCENEEDTTSIKNQFFIENECNQNVELAEFVFYHLLSLQRNVHACTATISKLQTFANVGVAPDWTVCVDFPMAWLSEIESVLGYDNSGQNKVIGKPIITGMLGVGLAL